MGPQQITTNPDLIEATMPDQVQGTTVKTGTGEAIPDHNLIFTDITASVFTIHTEANPGHEIGIIAATPGAAHNAHTPHIEVTAIDLTRTHHITLIAHQPHIEALQLATPEIIVNHTPDLPTNPQGEIHTDQVHIPAHHEANHTSRTQG